jgi:hypothetical protein
MVFNNPIVLILIFILFVWDVCISYFLIRYIRHYNRLIKDTHSNTLTKSLEYLLNNQSNLAKGQGHLEKQIEALHSAAQLHIQRIGINRFNPFSDTGGSQSFTLALLDSQNSGVVMTSLYARTGNRWYIKQVEGGHGVGLELSREEEFAIQKAKPVTN